MKLKSEQVRVAPTSGEIFVVMHLPPQHFNRHKPLLLKSILHGAAHAIEL